MNNPLDAINMSSANVRGLDEIRPVQEQVRKEAQDYLEGVAERLRVRALRVKRRVVEACDPGAAILDEAGKPGINLLALESHGFPGLSNLVLGSVARKLIHGTLKPVLVRSAA